VISAMRGFTLIRRRSFVGLLVVFLAAGSFGAGPASASNVDSSRVAVAGVPSWVTGAQAIGAVAADRQTSMTVYIRQPKAAEATAYATAVSNPRDPLYRHFLSPAQYHARFSANDKNVAALDRFLRVAGLTIESAPANHLYLRATGSAAQVERAFHTTLVNYWHNGTVTAAPAAPLLVPAGVASLIAGVSGPDTGTPVTVPPSPMSAVTCSSYPFQHTTTLPAAYGHTVFPTQGCGYTPAQIHGAYRTTDLLANGIDGRGVTVAVLLFYPIPNAVADINRFSSGHGLPPLASGQYTEVLPASFVEPPPPLCPLAGDQQEAEGDLEMVHNMAPGAHLTYVAAASCAPQDILTATNTIVDQHLANIVTNSYTLAFSDLPTAVVDAAHQVFVQAAAEGIGLFYGSGDLGDLSTFLGTPQTTWPESDPFVTSVGGTSLFVGKDNTWAGEVGWGMTLDPVVNSGGQASYQLPLPGSFFIGSGGGVTRYPQPAYQRGVVPAALAGAANPLRVVPDIAADADLATGVLVGITINGTYQEGPGGGTSISSPLFAGLEALADQAAGGPHGFVNPLVYSLHGTGIFHDIRNVPVPLALAFSLNGTTNLDTLQNDTALTATPGYDDQTGLGSPNGAAYVAALSHWPTTRQ
jgi:subtilase family serine protease